MRALEDALNAISWNSLPAEWNLTFAERQIMGALMARSGVIAREHLMNVLYDYNNKKRPEDADQVLRVLIYRMRNKLVAFGIYIASHYSLGYELAPTGKQIVLKWVQPSDTFPPQKEGEEDMLKKHMEGLEKAARGIFEPVVRETGVTHTVEEIEARRQARIKRGNN